MNYDKIDDSFFEGCNIILSNDIKSIPLFSEIDRNKVKYINSYSPYENFLKYPEFFEKSVNCILDTKTNFKKKLDNLSSYNGTKIDQGTMDLEIRYIDEYLNYRSNDTMVIKSINNFILLKFVD